MASQNPAPWEAASSGSQETQNPQVMNAGLLQIFGTSVKKTLPALTLPCRLFSGHRRWPFLQQHPPRLLVSRVQFPTSGGSALTAEIWHKHRGTLNPFSRRCFTCSYSEPRFPLSFSFFPLNSYLLHCFLFLLRYKHQNWTQPPGNCWITAKYRRRSIFVELHKFIHLLQILLLLLPPNYRVFNLF